MAGLTLCEAIPVMKRKRKPGGKVTIERARRVWGVDFVKILRFSTGPAILWEG